MKAGLILQYNFYYFLIYDFQTPFLPQLFINYIFINNSTFVSIFRTIDMYKIHAI